MTQTILHIDDITRASAAVLESSLAYLRACNKEYDGNFAKTGAKIGSTLRVRKPFRPIIGTGRVATAQEYVEEYVDLTVNTQNYTLLQFTSEERTMGLDDFSDRVLKPQLSAFAAYLDYQAINANWYKINNIVGTPGTTPANMQVWGDAMAKLDDGCAPRGDGKRWAVVNVDAMARTTYGSMALFHKSSNIADQYANGYVEDAIGLRWLMDQSIISLTNGTRTINVAQVDDAALTNMTEGTTTMHFDTFTEATATMKKGEVFTIAGVNDVHPITKQTLGYLKRFTVASDFLAAGNEGDLTFYPAMYTSASGGKQNVSAFPADGAAMTNLTGAASSGPYPHSIVQHQDAFIFATADLEIPSSGVASRARAGNIAVRVWKQSDIVNDTHLCRLDVLWGTAAVYPEWACRVTG